MLEAVKMKEACRICARELCGNQRRWIFHPAARVSLQVLLSHALGRELSRDGRGEFACSKCVFTLERMYRFDTVIARVEALSLERLHKLVLERDRLRQCIGGLYRKNNPEDGDAAPAGPVPRVLGTEEEAEDRREAGYSDMIRDDLTYSVHESWADAELPLPDQHQHLLPGPDSVSAQKQRRCRGCAALRVADSDYEAVCRVPRRVGRRSTSCGPSTRYSGAQDPVQTSDTTDFPLESSSAALDAEKSTCGGTGTGPSPASSLESLDTTVDTSSPPGDHEEDRQRDPEQDPSPGDKSQSESPLTGPGTVLDLLRGCEYRPVQLQGGSRIPVLLRTKPDQGLVPAPGGSASADPVLPPQQDLQAELLEMQRDWTDEYATFDLREQQLVTSDPSQVLKISPLFSDKRCPGGPVLFIAPAIAPHRCPGSTSVATATVSGLPLWSPTRSSSRSVCRRSDWSSCCVFQRRVEEQQQHLGGVEEAQEQLRPLQAKIRQSEARNQVEPRPCPPHPRAAHT